jgi:hypothetical protein
MMKRTFECCASRLTTPVYQAISRIAALTTDVAIHTASMGTNRYRNTIRAFTTIGLTSMVNKMESQVAHLTNIGAILDAGYIPSRHRSTTMALAFVGLARLPVQMESFIAAFTQNRTIYVARARCNTMRTLARDSTLDLDCSALSTNQFISLSATFA